MLQTHLSQQKSVKVAFTLWLFCGIFGIHRFYIGRPWSALLYMFTFGLCGIGWITDYFRLAEMVNECNNREPLVTSSLLGSVSVENFQDYETFGGFIEIKVADVETVERAKFVNGFGSEFLGYVRRDLQFVEGNPIFSPLAIYFSLAMCYAGSSGQLKYELEKVLHCTQSVHPRLSKMIESLESRDKRTVCKIVNQLWMDKNLKLKEDFVNLIKENYKSTVKKVDFDADPEKLENEINGFMELQTMKQIRHVISQNDLHENTHFIVTSTVLFQAYWKYPFNSKNTILGKFFVKPTKTKQIPFMSIQTRLYYLYGSHGEFEALEFPFACQQYSMVILLPAVAKGGLESLQASLETRKGFFLKILSGMKEHNVQFYLPKFKLSSSFGAKPMLQQMKLKRMFDENNASFDYVSTEQIAVSNIFHRSVIDVHEEGVDTGILKQSADSTSVEGDITKHDSNAKLFAVNRPFVVIIYHKMSKGILFVGACKTL